MANPVITQPLSRGLLASDYAPWQGYGLKGSLLYSNPSIPAASVSPQMSAVSLPEATKTLLDNLGIAHSITSSTVPSNTSSSSDNNGSSSSSTITVQLPEVDVGPDITVPEGYEERVQTWGWDREGGWQPMYWKTRDDSKHYFADLPPTVYHGGQEILYDEEGKIVHQFQTGRRLFRI